MSGNKKYPDLDAEEIDAIREEMNKGSSDIDRFFLLKLQITGILCLFVSAMMLFTPELVTYWLVASQGASPELLASSLTYRGVFILCYLAVAYVSWRKDRYTELVFGSATIMAFTNILLDLPYLIDTEFSEAPFSFTFGILLRVSIIALLVSIFRNLDRASYLQGKLFINPFSPLKL